MDKNLLQKAKAPMIALIQTKNILRTNNLKTKTKRAAALLLMLALLAPLAARAQEEELKVYEGTDTHASIPACINVFDHHTISQFIIPADDLTDMVGGTIKRIIFWAEGTNYPNCSVDVYLTEVDTTSFDEHNIQPVPKVNATVVYQGVLYPLGMADIHILFDEDYVYGGGNLLVGIENTELGLGYHPSDPVYFYGSWVDVELTPSFSGSLDSNDFYPSNFIPLTTFLYEPACPKLETLVVEDIIAHQATLSWTGGSGTYNVEIKPAGGEWTRVYTNLAANTCALENLVPLTEYEARVQSVCDGFISLWKTVRIPMTITPDSPYTQGFESPAGTAYYNEGYRPEHWGEFDNASVGPHNCAYWSHSGTQSLSFYNNGYFYTYTAAILPEFSNPIHNLQISFWMHIPDNKSGGIKLGYITVNDYGYGDSFTTLATFNSGNGNVVQHSMVLDNVPSDARRLAFKWEEHDMACFIDDLKVSINPALIVPHDIAVGNITRHEADITWEGACDSYALRYREIPTILKEGFEGGTMPQGWTIEGDNQNPDKTWRVGVGDHLSSTGTHSGNYNARITHNTNNQVTYLVTPALDLGEYGSAELSFWYVNGKWVNETDEFAVCYRMGSGGEWHELWSTAENHDTWTSQTIELTGLTNNYQIGFRFTDHYGYGVGLDDIALCEMPLSEWITFSEAESPHTLTGLATETDYEVQVKSNCAGYDDWSESFMFTTMGCEIPADVAVSDLTATGVTVSWTGFNDSYYLSYRQAPSMGTLFSEGFEGGTMPQGWTIEGDNQDPDKTWRVGAGDYSSETGTHSGNYNALITHNTNDQVTYLVTPAFDLGEYGSAELSFWFVNRKWDNDTDEFAVCYRIGNEGEWNELWSTSENHQAWTSQTVALTGLADNYQIGFRCTDHFGWGVGLDDIALFDMTHSEWIILSEAESPHTLTGLMPETEYEVKVQGVCEDEPTDWSESAYFTTLEATTFTKDIIAHTDNGGWYLIASPVAEAVTPTAQNGFLANEYDLYRFNQSANLEWENWKAEGEHYHFNLEAGRGYLYANSGDVTLTFVGTPHAATEPAEVPLAYDPAADFAGWNLVGNPLPGIAFIDRDFYVMNGDRDEIVAAEGNTVELMEGIFVIAEGENDTMTFTPASQNAIANNASLVVSLSQGRGSVIDRAIVRFDSNRTLPKFQLNPSSTKVYIQQSGKDYAVVAAEQTGEMPLNFKAEKNGTYTLRFDAKDVEFDYLHLIDNLTGADVDLLAVEPVETPTGGNGPSTSSGASYTFTAKTTDYASRFRLVFSANPNCGDAIGDNAPFAYISNGEIVITADAGDAQLQIFDMMGRIIVSCGGHTRCVPTSGMPADVYVLRLIDGDSVRTQKIVIQ